MLAGLVPVWVGEAPPLFWLVLIENVVECVMEPYELDTGMEP